MAARARPLTSGVGIETHPAFSPDGNPDRLQRRVRRQSRRLRRSGGRRRAATPHLPSGPTTSAPRMDPRRQEDPVLSFLGEQLHGQLRGPVVHRPRGGRLPRAAAHPDRPWQGRVLADGSRLAYVRPAVAGDMEALSRRADDPDLDRRTSGNSKHQPRCRATIPTTTPPCGWATGSISSRIVTGPVSSLSPTTTRQKRGLGRHCTSDWLGLQESISAGPRRDRHRAVSVGHQALRPEHAPALTVNVPRDPRDRGSAACSSALRRKSFQGASQNFGISPSGARAVFAAWGRDFHGTDRQGRYPNLTRSPAVADRDPRGRRTASRSRISPMNGEYELLHSRPERLRPGAPRQPGHPPSFFYTPTWSPDGKKIAYSDKRLQVVATSIFDKGAPNSWTPTLSGGFRSSSARSDLVAPQLVDCLHSRQFPSGLHAVFVYSLERGKVRRRLTDGIELTTSFRAFHGKRHLPRTSMASTDIGLTAAGELEMSR